MFFFVIALLSILLIIGSRVAQKKIFSYLTEVKRKKNQEQFYENLIHGSIAREEAEDQILNLKIASEELKEKKALREQIGKELNIEM